MFQSYTLGLYSQVLKHIKHVSRTSLTIWPDGCEGLTSQSAQGRLLRSPLSHNDSTLKILQQP